MPCMNTCCYCFSTYQGSLIIGVLSLLPGITGIGVLSHLIHTWDSQATNVNDLAAEVATSLQSSSAQIAVVTDFISSAAADMHTVCVVLLIYFVGSSLTALMLINGVYQSMRCMILPWLTVVLLRLLTIAVSAGIYLYIANGIPDTKMKERLLFAGLGLIPEIVLTAYGWLCVFSHYHHLQLLEHQVAPIGEEEPVEVLPAAANLKY